MMYYRLKRDSVLRKLRTFQFEPNFIKSFLLHEIKN